MATVKASLLVLDYTLYPRSQVNEQYVRELADALNAGAEFPAVVADRATRRLADGFHRTLATLRAKGQDAGIQVVWRSYSDDRAFFMEAMRLNSRHGRQFSPYDRARCAALAFDLKLEPELVASALSMTYEKFNEMTLRKLAIGPGNQLTPIKRTLEPFAGEHLSGMQLEGNRRAGGNAQLFYVNQTINLIECELLDTSNATLMARLSHLSALLSGILKQAS